MGNSPSRAALAIYPSKTRYNCIIKIAHIPNALQETLSEKFVTARPDVATVPITDETAFMILACDGFWDTVGNDDAVNFVLERLKMRRKEGERVNLYEICVELTTLAYNNGSDDNISIVLVAFEHGHRL